jgi:hypothetical protein
VAAANADVTAPASVKKQTGDPMEMDRGTRCGVIKNAGKKE